MGSLRGLSWSHGVTVTVMVATTILLHHHHVVQAQDIFVGFYDQTCPSAESIVTEVVKEATAKDPTVPAAMIRLLFHDCFVQVHNLLFQTKIYLPPLRLNTTRSCVMLMQVLLSRRVFLVARNDVRAARVFANHSLYIFNLGHASWCCLIRRQQSPFSGKLDN